MTEHDFYATGKHFALRPVHLSDAEFILSLRNRPELSDFLNKTSPHIEDEMAWIQSYFLRPGDFYFVVADRLMGMAQGTIGLYNQDAARKRIEMGRWIIRPGSLAAPESALLAYQIGFDLLGVDLIYCHTLLEHRQVLSFHDSAGLKRRDEPVTITVNGESRHAVEQFVDRSNWDAVKATLSVAADAAAKLLAPK